MLNLLREMLHSPVLDIVQRLKHSTGMTVTELCTAMKMSYMGVKQHCVDRSLPHGSIGAAAGHAGGARVLAALGP